MRRFLLSLALLGFLGGVVFAAEDKPLKGTGNPENGGDEKESPKNKKEYKAGLVAHYFKDPTDWDGNWKAGQKPTVDPAEYTFKEYKFSRREPLINHLFIRRGWFSVRWVGYVKVQPGLGRKGLKDPPNADPVDVNFEFWADDGARVLIDGVKIIDDWRACAETEEGSHRKATVKLTPGLHRIVVEYFQGESLKKQDRDPAKLYWSIPAYKMKRRIISAAHFCHTREDLEDYEPSTKDKADQDNGEGKDGDDDDDDDEDDEDDEDDD